MKALRSAPSRSTLEAAAQRVGYQLTQAGTHARMAAAQRYERLPRWELRPSGSQWANDFIACDSLADVVDRIDEIEIRRDLNRS